MKKKKKQECIILIDGREQRPYFMDKAGDEQNFPGLQIEWAPLQTGDYSIKTMSSPDCEFSVCVERKSLIDLFGSTGNGRERLEKEFQRMSKFDHAIIVIENDLATLFKHPPSMSEMRPKAVFRTLLAWSQRYGIFPWFCPNRIFAEKFVYISLMRFWADRQRGGKCEFDKI